MQLGVIILRRMFLNRKCLTNFTTNHNKYIYLSIYLSAEHCTKSNLIKKIISQHRSAGNRDPHETFSFLVTLPPWAIHLGDAIAATARHESRPSTERLWRLIATQIRALARFGVRLYCKVFRLGSFVRLRNWNQPESVGIVPN